MRARLANAAWALASRRAASKLRAAWDEPEAAQLATLRRILRNTADTAYGRAHDLEGVRGLEDFQDRAPLVTWDDLEPWVARIAAGEAGVLTVEPVVLLEPTGGSSGGTKRIPYTRSLQREVQTAVGAWVSDLFQHVPAAARGPAYWAVSPAVPHEQTAGGVPVGFEDDGAYLSPLHRGLARATLAVPGAVRHVLEVDPWRYATLRALLARRDLALVSVWNPTFLSLLLGPLRAWSDRLAADLEAGTLTPPGPVPPDVLGALRKDLRPDPARAAQVRTAVALEADAGRLHARLWPGLAVVSAWADAPAAGPARDLEAALPQAVLQPKGLMATEGVVTIPLWGRDGGAPALTSHVLEFVPEGGGRPRFAHDLEPGARYAVALTTGGGLVRYRLGDLVEVVGRVGRTPMLRLLGRGGPVSDVVGEKLHGDHVARALAALGLETAFAMVAPDGDARPARYALFVESPAPDAAALEAARRLDRALSENVHYAHARSLGQLGPAAAFRVRGGGARAYLEGCRALGQRLGSVKPVALHRDGGWAARFQGAFLEDAG